MNKYLLTLVVTTVLTVGAKAQDGSSRVALGIGLLYENGCDMTLSYEREVKYHNAWEIFANGYLKWRKCDICRHICPESFWHNYNSYALGVAYKPCISRGRNHHGNFRFGASGGSDSYHFLGGIHIGYEHDYILKGGIVLYGQVKTDLVINGKDLFRTGLAIGVKLPLKR